MGQGLSDAPCRCRHKPRFDVVAKLGAWCHSYRWNPLITAREVLRVEWWFRYWCPLCGGITETTFDTIDNRGPRWFQPEALGFDDQYRLTWNA